MDGQPCRCFFLDPQLTFHRRYEALRAFFVEDRPVAEIASRFGYTPTALNVMISRFHARFAGGVFPPFCPRRSGATSRSKAMRRPERPGRTPHRGPASLEPPLWTAAGNAQRWGLPVLAAPGQTPVRPNRRPGRLSRLEDGSRLQRDLSPADAQAPRQRTTRTYQRLQFRRSPWPVRRSEHPPQEVVRNRLFLSDHARKPTGTARRGGWPLWEGAIPRRRHLLAGLPSHPLPGRPDRARSALPAAPRLGRPERPDLLRAGAGKPLPVLCQRQSDPWRSTRRTVCSSSNSGTLSRTTIPSGSISIPSSSITPSYRESTNEASTSSPFDAAGPESCAGWTRCRDPGWTGRPRYSATVPPTDPVCKRNH